MTYRYNKKLWQYVVTTGKKQEPASKSIANRLTRDDINTIIATMDYFNATDNYMRQSVYDLTIPRYRVFDWLAMCIMGRNDDDRKQNNVALKVLIYAWKKANGNVDKFIYNLRRDDYEIDDGWEKIKIDIKE